MKGKNIEHDYSKQLELVFSRFELGCNYEFQIHGPAVTRYVFSPNPGTKVSSIIKNADTIASVMPVERTRIVAPIPELAAIGVEVPNRNREIIRFETMVPALEDSKYTLPLALGRTVDGYDYLIDLAEAPHILIAGTQDSGKTMLLHSMICSLYCTSCSDEIKYILYQLGDREFEFYKKLGNMDVSVLNRTEDVFRILDDLVVELERRIELLSAINSHKISDYNNRVKEKLPYIVVVIDEIAEIVHLDGKRFDSLVRKITAVGRFIGIHLILTTGKPYADTISIDVWSNMPTAIALQMPNQLSSRLVLEYAGGEKLLGNGDMLYYRRDMHQPIRIQGVLCGPYPESGKSYLMRELLANIWSKDYREYLKENPVDWDFHQVISFIIIHVRSGHKESRLLQCYAHLLSDPHEIHLCRLLANDAKRLDDVSPSTEAFFVQNIEKGNPKCGTKLYHIDLSIPKIFSQFDVVRYRDSFRYGEKSQIGIIVSVEPDNGYCLIYNLRKMNTPREDIYWESKADIVNPFNIERIDLRCLNKKEKRNLRMVVEKINRVGGWPVFRRLMVMKERGESIDWW